MVGYGYSHLHVNNHFITIFNHYFNGYFELWLQQQVSY